MWSPHRRRRVGVDDMVYAKIVLAVDTDRARATRKAVAGFGMPELKGMTVLIKPNFNTADPAPGSTHNDTLRTMVELVKEKEPRKVTVGDRSGPADTTKVFRDKGVFVHHLTYSTMDVGEEFVKSSFACRQCFVGNVPLFDEKASTFSTKLNPGLEFALVGEENARHKVGYIIEHFLQEHDSNLAIHLLVNEHLKSASESAPKTLNELTLLLV